jgi:hypothetical protein
VKVPRGPATVSEAAVYRNAFTAFLGCFASQETCPAALVPFTGA